MNLEPQDADDPFRLGRFEPPSVEELNQLIPDYEFVSLIDRGGMGAVYQAKQKALGRMVAVKMLPPALRNRRVFAERFHREARILAKLSHRHIVSIYDYGEIPGGGSMFYAMEYVKGTNLRHLMRKGDMSSRQMLTIVTQICDALQYSHHKGVIHRDVKPANILIDEQGNVKVADFGLAKKLGLDADGQGLTSASDALGTPDYIAPEAMTRDQQVDHRADIYSLGVMLYEMLTGSVPRGLGWDPPSRAAGADSRLDVVVSTALQTNPNKRYQQVSDVSRALQGMLNNGPIKQATPGASAKVDAGAVTKPYSHLPAPGALPPAHRRVKAWGGGVIALFMLIASGKMAMDGTLMQFFAPGPTPMPFQPEDPARPPVSPQEAQRALAEWVISRGGMINVTPSSKISLTAPADRPMGDKADIRDFESIPKDEFEVWRVSVADCDQFNDEDLAGLVKHCEAAGTVNNLNLHGSHITPSSLALLIKLAPQLTHLRLTNTAAFTEDSVHFLKACTNLTHLFVTTSASDPMNLDVADDLRLVQKMQEFLPNCRITVE